MYRSNILLVLTLLVLISITSALYDELYRPQLHFSPPTGWMNDPNGIVYHDGVFHLFYQHNPYDTIPSHESASVFWGHAISTDLVHWRNLDIALSPPVGKSFWSGSTVVDQYNITGFQADADKKPLVAVFTSVNISTGEQEQWLAYSNDAPEYKTFEFYENNPVINKLNSDGEKKINFRDPAIYEWQDYFVLFVNQDNRSMIFNSPDMKKWELASEFGEYEGKHGGTWECPSFFPLNVTINGALVEKHVLLITLTDYVFPTIQYFIGSFDGKTFRNENPPETVLWADYGPDSFAGITFNQLPDGRRIFISWMNHWKYAISLNPGVWSGNMGLTRELNLKRVGNDIRLGSQPVREVEALRMNLIQMQNVKISNNFRSKIIEDDGEDQHTVDIEMTLDLSNLKKGAKFDIVFFGNHDKLNITLEGNEFTLDRSRAGRTDFSEFGRPWKAPRFIDSPELKLRIIIDRSSIEFFADDGLTVMTALFFSKEDIASNMAIYVHSFLADSSVHLKQLNAYNMKSIWN